LISPRISHRWRSFQRDMFATFLSQVIADGESSLTTADDNRIDFVQHGRLLDSEVSSIESGYFASDP
jgi:hypothetical protein